MVGTAIVVIPVHANEKRYNPQFDEVRDYSDGLIQVKPGGKWGYINNEGKYIINPQFDWVSKFSDGLAMVSIGKNWGYIDKDGKYV